MVTLGDGLSVLEMLDNPIKQKKRRFTVKFFFIHTYNPGQKSLGQYRNIHIFLSFYFLGFLLKLCILIAILLQFSLRQSYTKLKLRKILDTRVQHCLWGEGRGWTYVNWKTPQKRKIVPRLLSMIVVLHYTAVQVCKNRNLSYSPIIILTIQRAGRRHPFPDTNRPFHSLL